MDGDQPAVADEQVELGDVQLHRVAQRDGVGHEEPVVLVVHVLVPLVGADRVLDGEVVEAELAGEAVEVGGVGLVEIDPHHVVTGGQLLDDPVEIVEQLALVRATIPRVVIVDIAAEARSPHVPVRVPGHGWPEPVQELRVSVVPRLRR